MEQKVSPRLIELLNYILLLSYGFMSLVIMARTAQFNFEWIQSAYDFQQSVMKFWVIVALIKVYYYHDTYKKETIVAFVLILLAVLAKVFGMNEYVYLVAAVVSFFDFEFNVIAKFYVSIVGFGLITIVACSVIGIIPNYYTEDEGRLINNYYSLGFASHNAVMIYWLFILMALVYIFKKSYFKDLLLVGLAWITLELWLFTSSNTGLILGMMICSVLLMELLVRKVGISEKCTKIIHFFNRVMIGMPIYAVIITALGVLFYNKVGTNYGITVISRWLLLCRELEKIGIKLPYQTINSNEIYSDVNFNWLIGTGSDQYGGGDILYGNLFIKGGLVLLIIYIYVHVYILLKTLKMGEYELFLICIVLSILGCLESVAIDVPFIVFDFILFSRLGCKKKILKHYKARSLRR